jgi:hypothetical protein
MFPVFPYQDIFNGHVGNAILSGQGTCRHTPCQSVDFQYLKFCQFSFEMGFSMRMPAPPFSVSIGHVFGICSKEKTSLIIDAWRGVAMMQDMKPFWDRAMADFPGNTVSIQFFKIWRSRAYCSVPSRAFSSPEPAGVGFFDM